MREQLLDRFTLQQSICDELPVEELLQRGGRQSVLKATFGQFGVLPAQAVFNPHVSVGIREAAPVSLFREGPVNEETAPGPSKAASRQLKEIAARHRGTDLG